MKRAFPPAMATILGALGLSALAFGQHGDWQALKVLEDRTRSAALCVGSDQARDTVALIVAAMADVECRMGGPLLPTGTLIDDVRWAGNVLEIDLTLPPLPPGWYLTPIDLETISAALGRPFLRDDSFGGTRIRARPEPGADYAALSQLLLPENSSESRPELADGLASVSQPGSGRSAQRGPVVNAARQPQGALSGVTVFLAAGHGWTAGSSSWALQRPILWEMVEDYGNLDMLNYIVHYAFNAGATVVPFRPVGWQPIEIVLDNDDPGVTCTGTWQAGSGPKYYENWHTNSGIPYVWTTAAPTESATARYSATITVSGFYPVYCFTIAGSNRTNQLYRVRHSGGLTEIRVDHRVVGNGWIWLGDYYLVAGQENYVEISNQADEGGVVVADAIRWGGGMGDIVRPGPNQVSGYPRDEEAHRYWAHAELGNHAVGFDSNIWDIPGYDDLSDNVRVAAKWAREMNQEPPGGVLVERWRRVYLELHSNAASGTARGQMCLITDLGPTTYQTQFATILSNEIDGDLLIVDDEFEHPWYDRASPTYTGSYGAICTEANGNEFDATIVELAFHDNQLDAELLRDARVRAAMARACVQGIIRFLNSLPGSEVPLAFPPDTPRDFRAELAADGSVVLAWAPPLADAARGDPATGYVVYQSTNGYGFGDPIVLGNVLSTTLGPLAPGQTRYFRVAATNAGGESMPTEVLAVRRPTTGQADVLVVNGFDRLRRQINPIQVFTQPPQYAGMQIERQIWRRSNSYDYIVQYAEALEAADAGFSSCTNEAVIASQVALGNYAVVIWILGQESTEDATLNPTEQTLLANYLASGGALFISGSQIGFDLVGQGNGAAFMHEYLHAGYQADNAGTYNVSPTSNGIFAGLLPFDFDLASGAVYQVRAPDVLTPIQTVACLFYVGGLGGAAGIQYTSPTFNVVTFGFPFEAISSAAVRAQLMQRILDFLRTASGPLPFDFDNDNDVDIDDFNLMAFCWQGPEIAYEEGHFCLVDDADGDRDVDLADFARLQLVFTGPLGP
jgi:hypothetical protein